MRVNIVTRPAKKSGCDEGFLQVELLDASLNPLSGFTRDECEILRGDQRAARVKWTGGEKAPPAAVHAKFYLKRVFLYGFSFSDAK